MPEPDTEMSKKRPLSCLLILKLAIFSKKSFITLSFLFKDTIKRESQTLPNTQFVINNKWASCPNHYALWVKPHFRFRFWTTTKNIFVAGDWKETAILLNRPRLAGWLSKIKFSRHCRISLEKAILPLQR